jgi:NAD(P)-dependent dehydrogenase (short-subunit alcohol dehydrogenase family)
MTLAELKGRNIVVTGGANGIGAAIVRAFHGQGARVFFCDVDARAGRRLERQLADGAEFARVDLTREREVVKWITGIGRRHKRIHALINNAARDTRIELGRCSTREWDDLFATNLRAYFLCARESVKWMRAGSSIVNFSSITFHAGMPHLSAYVATKAGALGFTRSLARELGPRRIRVNTVTPGWVMTERQLREFITPAIRKFLYRAQCIPDLNQPEEIAQVVLFLASDASRAMTGQELLVDRGWHHS